MRKNITSLILLILFITSASTGYSQLNINQMIAIRVGESFEESKPKIKEMFSQKPIIMKADFLGAYQIEYRNTSFDYYGNADYTFQYIKDTLVSTSVEFTFEASDTMKFERLLTTLINEFNNDKSKTIDKKYSDLNVPKVLQYIHRECVRTTDKMDKNYKPINKKHLGRKIWFLYNNSFYTGKFLMLTIGLGERHTHGNEGGISIDYDGGFVHLVLQIIDEKLQYLEDQAYELSNLSYKLINDEDGQIKLKFQNGVYLVPVKLNNTLSLDFVLDLGASDMSISPDIFLVLYRAGTIEESDFIGSQTYQFADGTTAKSNVFNIKSIQLGDKEIKNVRASISNSLSAPLLLGQSALKKLAGYRIDNYQKLLIIE